MNKIYLLTDRTKLYLMKYQWVFIFITISLFIIIGVTINNKYQADENERGSSREILFDIYGRVVNTSNDPIASIIISFDDSLGVKTDDNGEFNIQIVSSGYILRTNINIYSYEDIGKKYIYSNKDINNSSIEVKANCVSNLPSPDWDSCRGQGAFSLRVDDIVVEETSE